MSILFVAASPAEVAFIPTTSSPLQIGERVPITDWPEAELLITGVGMTATAFYLSRALSQGQASLAVNLGLAGSLSPDCSIGRVYRVEKDCFGDLGAEDAKGGFLDLFDLNLPIAGAGLFVDRFLYPIDPKLHWADSPPEVPSVSVNTVHGKKSTIEAFSSRFPKGLETMEGAAFTLACGLHGLPSLQLRAVSNRVEERNREAWRIAEALKALEVCYQSLRSLYLSL